MGLAERAGTDQATFRQHSGYGMDNRGFKRLSGIKVGQNAGQTGGQH